MDLRGRDWRRRRRRERRRRRDRILLGKFGLFLSLFIFVLRVVGVNWVIGSQGRGVMTHE